MARIRPAPRARSKLLVPNIEFEPNIGIPEAGQVVTRTVELDGTTAKIEKVLRLIRFASKYFKRRGWTQEFLAEREEVARNYATRSRYFGLETWLADEDAGANKDLWKNTRLEGTIGITHSESTLDEVAALTEEEFLSDRNRLVPQEETLRKRLTRYFDSRGKSIIVELRTYAKDVRSEELVLKTLRADLVALTFKTIRDYPELYDAPIIYTYGDKASVRMYRKQGFKIQEHLTPLNQPIHHGGTDWWILAATPRDLEKRWLFDLRGTRIVSNLNQPYPVKLSDGQDAYAARGTRAFIGDDEIVGWFTTQYQIEVFPGVFADAGSEIVGSGRDLGTVSSMGENTLGVPRGSSVTFQEGRSKRQGTLTLGTVNTPDGSTINFPDLGLAIRGYVQFAPDGKTPSFVSRLAHDYEVRPGLVAAEGTQLLDVRVSKARPGKLEVDRMTLARGFKQGKRTYRFGDTIDLEWKNGIPRVVEVYPVRKLETGDAWYRRLRRLHAGERKP